MDFVGVITEYNPFHNGHAAQLALLRGQGAATVVVCMGDGVTQRGALPLLPGPVRAAAALHGGADLVVALPAPYAGASAEGFAAAGVRLLGALGCDTLAFGAETPDAALLLRAAQLLLGPAHAALLRQKLDAGMPFAAARAAAAEALCPGMGALLAQPNNILGVEYCKAILAQGSPLRPLALPRLGAAHGVETAGLWQGQQVASAGALRHMVEAQGMEAIRPFVPPQAYGLYCQAAAQGGLPEWRWPKQDTAVLARLRGKTAAEFAPLRGMAEGLDHRLEHAAHAACTLPELYAALYTKRYPNARLHRLVMDAVLGVPAGLPPPPYLHILGARRAALPLLKHASLPASTSLAELTRTGPQAAQIGALHSAAVDFSSLCRQVTQPAGLAFTAKPVVL